MRFYVAGPYSTGDVAVNVRSALVAADALVELGHVPYVPHLTHFWHLVSPKPYEWWLAYDLAWLPFCDALLRLDGPSSGADGELTRAKELGLRVYHSLEEVPAA